MTVRMHDDACQNFAPSAQGSVDRTVFGSLKTVLVSMWQAADDLYLRVQNRRGVEAMLELDESVLRDIGVTRDEVRWASRLPLSYRAGDELRRASGRRLRRS